MCVEKLSKLSSECFDERSSSIIFLEDGTMQQYFQFNLDPLERPLSCRTCSLNVSSNSTGNFKDFIVVGTGYEIPEERENPSRGRILIFEVEMSPEDRRSVSLVIATDVKGAVFTIADMNGKMVVGVSHKVLFITVNYYSNLLLTYYYYRYIYLIW